MKLYQVWNKEACSKTLIFENLNLPTPESHCNWITQNEIWYIMTMQKVTGSEFAYIVLLDIELLKLPLTAPAKHKFS